MNDYNIYVLSGNVTAQKLLLQVNIPFIKLYEYATFSFMTDPTDDSVMNDIVTSRNKYYQRRVDDQRLKGIKSFILSSINNELKGNTVASLFPTAILLASQIDETNFELYKQYCVNESQLFSNDLYIVDGQHRLAAMKSLYDEIKNNHYRSNEDSKILEYLENFRFNCTLLLNYDFWEQAQVFADVNFTQKKVDKSLYYTIYGMHYSTNPEDYKRNYIYIAHNLVRYANTSPSSPLNNGIMMLGPKQSSRKGYISQACLAEEIMKNIYGRQAIWYVDYNDTTREPAYRYMAVELLSFFACVKQCLLDSWPNEFGHQSILMKTTGVGAMMALMTYIHKYKLPEKVLFELKTTTDDILESYVEVVIPLINKITPHQMQLFGLKSSYAGTGGKGLVKKLFHNIVNIIESESDEEADTLIDKETILINGVEVSVNIYRTNDNYYRFTLSHIFKNPDQMDAYNPGSGSIAASLSQLQYKLGLYVKQVSKDALCVKNKYFKSE